MMQKRRLGKTGHTSTIVAFGTAAFWRVSQDDADRAMEVVLKCSVNHIDVAPEYGDAEARVGPWMREHRKDFFLACKTLMRTAKEAREELHRSLERLRTDHFDLYQLHSLDTAQELETALGQRGAMEAIIDAQREGLIKRIGITGHNLSIHALALKRFDFDTIMFPFNYIFFGDANYRKAFKRLIEVCVQRDVGVMIIKSIARGNWEEEYRAIPFYKRPYTTWYRPFEAQAEIKSALRFVLSHPVSTVISASDLKLLPLMLSEAKSFYPMEPAEKAELVKKGRCFKQLAFTFDL